VNDLDAFNISWNYINNAMIICIDLQIKELLHNSSDFETFLIQDESTMNMSDKYHKSYKENCKSSYYFPFII